jgi:hypothetical protein
MHAHLRTALGSVAAAALLLSATGCGGDGGDSGGRPSAAAISSALRSADAAGMLGNLGGKLDKQAADCIGEKFHDSKISDAALRALVRKDQDYKGSKADQTAAAALVPQLGSCIGAK